MAITAFPPVELADDYGLLAVGGDLSVASLLLAYRSGVFPWPIVGERRITWFAPPRRALISQMRCSRSLRRVLRNGQFRFRVNSCFSEVVLACSKVKRGEKENSSWITPSLIQAYTQLHSSGYAHCVECYEGSKLVGGVYGVLINGYFAGESMFHYRNNASKVALYLLIQYLRHLGINWLDCQVINPHLTSLGAIEVDRSEFMSLLGVALQSKTVQFNEEGFMHFLLQLGIKGMLR